MAAKFKCDLNAKAKDFVLTKKFGLSPGDDEPDYDDKLLAKITKHLLKHHKPKRGDTVRLDVVAGYRNTGVLIFDGTRVVNLDGDFDDYGTVPKQFRVLDEKDGCFPPKYWVGNITHNTYVWFNAVPHLETLLKNIVVESKEKALDSSRDKLYTTVDVCGYKLHIYAVWEGVIPVDECVVAFRKELEWQDVTETKREPRTLFECESYVGDDNGEDQDEKNDGALYLRIERLCPKCGERFTRGGGSRNKVTGVYTSYTQCDNNHSWSENKDGTLTYQDNTYE